MNFARLNHILIPSTKEGRDRFRNTRTGRLVKPLFRLYLALTPEGRFLTIFWLLTGAAGLEVGTTQIYVLFALVTGLLAASLLARRAYRLADLTVSLEAPLRTTVGEPLTVTLVVRNRGERPVGDLDVSTPLLPWDGRWLPAAADRYAVDPGETTRIRLAARFTERGDHHLDPFHLGRTVPLGVACGPVIDTPGVRFLVRPRPAVVVALPLALGREARSQGGRALAPDARDLAGTRPYRPGDRVRDLHARSWARLGIPVVREWREDRVADAAVVLELTGSATQDAEAAAVSLAAGLIVRLAELSAALDAVVVSGQAPLTGPALEQPDLALDAVARARPEALSAAAIEPAVRGLGTVFWVTDGPSDAAPTLRRRGVPVELIFIRGSESRWLRAAARSPAAPIPAGARVVAARDVLSGARIDLAGGSPTNEAAGHARQESGGGA